MDERQGDAMPFKTSEPTEQSTPMKELAGLLVILFASTPDLNYSSKALLSMARRFKAWLDAGVSEEELVAHCRDRLSVFSEALVIGTPKKVMAPTVVDAKLIRATFMQCPKPPTFPTLKEDSGAAIKKLLIEFREEEKA